MSWHTGRLCGFDLETASPDPEQARIVTACIVHVGGGHETHATNWLSDVNGEDIPEETTRIHGVTTAKAHAEGLPAKNVVDDIVTALDQAASYGIPIVAMNARYDFTVLDREARRLDVTPLANLEGGFLRVVDPFVLDKQFDQRRRGSRTLTALCQHYGVRLDGAHSADADAIAACRVAWRIASLRPELGAMPLEQLHKQQIVWAAEQAASLADYFRRTPGKEDRAATVRGDWPLIPHQTTSKEG